MIISCEAANGSMGIESLRKVLATFKAMALVRGGGGKVNTALQNSKYQVVSETAE